MTRRDRGNPELGGWRPLRPGEIPMPIKRPDYRTIDPFGYEEMGGPATKRSRDVGRTRRNVDRVENEQKDVLRRRYRKRAKDGDWWTCRDIAHELLTNRLRADERTEALYALGFAQEMLENGEEARQCYNHALQINPHHGKALRRLRRLSTKKDIQ